MSYIPEQVRESDLSRRLYSKGLVRVHQGKVRATYTLLGDFLLHVATDRLSIFDFVLNASVSQKGEVLTALTAYWLKEVLVVPNHLRAFGAFIDEHLRSLFRNDLELQRCALVVERYVILPIEAIVRGYLTGSGWKEYQKSGTVCGIRLPKGLKDGSKLPEPIFTPSTKAEQGHDVNISYSDMERMIGQGRSREVKSACLDIYQMAASCAEDRGIIIADTKFEWGVDPSTDEIVLCDEVLTPDSSRFWDEEDWKEAQAQGRSPHSMDKQIVRDWGKAIETPFFTPEGKHIIGLNHLDPENAEHLRFVSGLQVPDEIIKRTSEIYLEIFRRLTGQTLQEFQLAEMKIH